MYEKQSISKGRLWTSYGLQGLVSGMFLMGIVNNLMQTEMAVKGSLDMGYPEGIAPILGVVQLIALALYIFPKTSILGAAIITAWLGGAVATHVIHRDPMSMTLFPVIFGVIVWVAIWLRDQQIQAVFPLKK